MWIERLFYSLAVFGRLLFSTTILFSAAALVSTKAMEAAEPPTVKLALGIVPQQSDVEIDTPDPKTIDQCKIALAREGKATGWVVTGPAGQPLRRFMDTDDNGEVDQFSFYKNGLEVYRDIISKPNSKKKDQFRWLNSGGMRWGIDTNGDGKIDAYKQISAEEVSRLAVRALVSQDASLLAPVVVTKDDLKHLGIKGPLETKLLAAVADPTGKLKKAAAGSKIIQPRTTWMRFDAAPPASIPADANKTPGDLVVYENVMAIVDNGNPAAPGLVHIGELLRVGDVWKMTSLPTPMEGTSIEIIPGLVMHDSLSSAGPGPAVPAAVPKKVQELIEQLTELMKKPPASNATRPEFEKYQKKLEGILALLIDDMKTDEERAQWTRQLLDAILVAVQSGKYPEGVARLKTLDAEVRNADPKSPLAALARYRLMVAEFTLAMQTAADNDARQKIHDGWLTDLEDFLEAHPKADDAPDAALQLAMELEFAGKLEKARKWYERIVADYADSPAAPRAAGVMTRFDLVGKTLKLSGASLAGGTIDVKQLRGKLLAVFFWDTNSNLCLEDLPQLKALYDAHHSQGFEIVGVNLDAVKAAVAPYLTKNGVKWPQIHEPGGLESPPAKEFGIVSLPTMFFVDGEGKVINRNATVADLKSALAERLAKK